MSEPTPATSVTALAKALRAANGNVLPASTVSSLAQLTSDMSRLTSSSALASLRSPVDGGVLATVAQMPRPLFEFPEVTWMVNRVPTTWRGSTSAP